MNSIDDIVLINNNEYIIIRLLGKGKDGYCYLAKCKDRELVVKQIHHEPWPDYIPPDNKILKEVTAYSRLKRLNIRIPKLIDIDRQKEIIVKEYIEGETLLDLIIDDRPIAAYASQIKQMGVAAKKAGWNLDYFPTNYVINNGHVYYVDYECDDYDQAWSFNFVEENYYHKTDLFSEYYHGVLGRA